MRRNEALYAVIGGVVGAVMVMAAGSLSPLGAQSAVRDVAFGKITCREIRVIDTDGQPLVVIDRREHGGAVVVRNKDGKSGAILRNNEYGAYVEVVGNRGTSYGYIGTEEHVVGIGCHGKDGKRREAAMSVHDDLGAAVSVSNKDEESMVQIRGGAVVVYGEGEKSEVDIGTGEHGGYVRVSGKDGEPRAVMMAGEGDASFVSVHGKDGKINALMPE